MAKKGNKKPALGRGLGALLEAQQARQESSAPAKAPKARKGVEDAAVNMAGRVALLPISVIDANPDQPRRTFEPFALNELADSIKTLGIIQPLLVRALAADDDDGERFEIVAGQRR